MTRSPMTALGRTRPRNLTKSGVLSAESPPFFIKYYKREKAGSHGSEYAHGNGDNLLCGSHRTFSSLSCEFFIIFLGSSNLFRHKKKLKIINAIAGIMKLLFPKRSRQASEHMTPIKAGRCRLAVSHWSRNITKKRAVITNSIPVVSK